MHTENNNYRKTIVDSLFPYFEQDPRYYLLVCDMGFGAIERLQSAFPCRVMNCGVMEQGTVGVAAGMSMSGLVPIVYSIVNFLAFRAIEQIRNDVVNQGLNVKLIGTGANDYFRFLGSSHCCGDDDVKIMQMIGMPVYDPYASGSAYKELVDTWMLDTSGGYFRV